MQNDKVSNDIWEWSDINSIPSRKNNIIPKHVLDNMCIKNKCAYLGVMIGKWRTSKY